MPARLHGGAGAPTGPGRRRARGRASSWATLISRRRVGRPVTGCGACGKGERRRLRFGTSLVECCSLCHALEVSSVVDARVPNFEGHVKALREEIAAEKEEGTGKALVCSVESA